MKDSTVQKLVGGVGVGALKRVKALSAKTGVRRAAMAALYFGIGYSLAHGVVFDHSAPFGVAFVAAAGVGMTGAAGFLGVLLGYLQMWETANGIIYVAAAVLTLVTAIVFANTPLMKKSYFMPLTALLATAVVRLVFMANAAGSQEVLVLVTELVLAAGGTYFYSIALQDGISVAEDSRPSSVLKRSISYIILFGTVLLSISSVLVMGVLSPGRTLALMVVMFMALRGGAGAGAAGGVSIGLAMDLAWGMPYFSMAYGVSGLMAGIFRENGRLWSVSVFVVSHAVSTLWLVNNMVRSSVLLEAFVASVLFMLIPDSALGTLNRRLTARAVPEVDTTPDLRLQKRAAQMLAQTATAYSALHKALEAAWQVEERPQVSDEALVIDRVATRLCHQCALMRICWEKEFARTCDAMQGAALSLRKHRTVQREDFADWFRARCLSFSQFIDIANEESISLFYRRRYNNRMNENRGLVSHQYAETARLLRGMSAQLEHGQERYPSAEQRVRVLLAERNSPARAVVTRSGERVTVEIEDSNVTSLYHDRRALAKELSDALEVPLNLPERLVTDDAEQLLFTQCEPLRVQVGSAAAQKEGEQVSGDSGTYFKLPDGRLIALLSDGMGSGAKAARESGWVVRLLEHFLRVGIAPDTALRTVNSALLAKGDNGDEFVTVDMLVLDLLNGEAKFYKYGAAPSYIRRGEKVHRVTCSALPAGVAVRERQSLDVTTMKASHGNLLVIVSDGIADPLSDQWLQQMIAKSGDGDCKDLATSILEQAQQRNGSRDDMSVLVLRVLKRLK